MRRRDGDDCDDAATNSTTRDAFDDDPTSPIGDDYERMLSDDLGRATARDEAPVTKKIERWVRALGAAGDGGDDGDDGDDGRRGRANDSSATTAAAMDARKMMDEMSRARDHGVQETAVDEEDLDADVDGGLREREAARRLEKYGANDWATGEDGDDGARARKASAGGGGRGTRARAVRAVSARGD